MWAAESQRRKSIGEQQRNDIFISRSRRWCFVGQIWPPARCAHRTVFRARWSTSPRHTHGLATHFGNNARSSFHHKSHGESTPIFFNDCGKTDGRSVPKYNKREKDIDEQKKKQSNDGVGHFLGKINKPIYALWLYFILSSEFFFITSNEMHLLVILLVGILISTEEAQQRPKKYSHRGSVKKVTAVEDCVIGSGPIVIFEVKDSRVRLSFRKIHMRIPLRFEYTNRHRLVDLHFSRPKILSSRIDGAHWPRTPYRHSNPQSVYCSAV